MPSGTRDDAAARERGLAALNLLAAGETVFHILGPRHVDPATLALRQTLQTHRTPYPGLENDLATVLPSDFARRTPFERFSHLHVEHLATVLGAVLLTSTVFALGGFINAISTGMTPVYAAAIGFDPSLVAWFVVRVVVIWLTLYAETSS